MNNLNSLEKQLESWMPRQPSEKLKRQLFPPATVWRPKPAPLVMPGWAKFALAPCLALLMVILVSADHHKKTSYLAMSGSSSNVLASLSSNLIACCLMDTQAEQANTWIMPTGLSFDWTNRGRSLSTTGSFPLWNTNL
jgi:hypothetical protein